MIFRTSGIMNRYGTCIKIITSLYLCLAFALFVSIFLQSCSETPAIQIGFIGGLTGRVADLGISGRNGVILAIEEQNMAGGINGRNIQLILADDKQDKTTAKKQFAALAEQNPEVIIGHMTSSMSVATVPLANERRILLLSPTSTTQNLTGIDDYFIRVCAATKVYAQQMAEYLRNKAKLNSITIVYDLNNKAYTESWTTHFSEEFVRLGGMITNQVTYTSSADVSFEDLSRKALEKKSDGIVISSSAVDVGIISQQIRKLNTSVLIGTSEWAATEKLLELGGNAVEGIIVSQFFDRFSTTPKYLQFKKLFFKRFGQEPGFASVGAYDATNVALEALKHKGRNQNLKQSIIALGSFEGVQGNINIDKYGDSDRMTYLSIVKNGQFTKPE